MPTVLSIQSHVALGRVGNRAAMFALERLGCETIHVNTVQFSNHTGYHGWTGQVFTAAHIADIIDGVAARGGLDQCDALLTGYLGSGALGDVVLTTLGRMRAAQPNALYCCDPVMGDRDQGLYVAADLPEFFRHRAVPAADLITPNQFELEVITGTPVASLESALAATAAARKIGPRLVLVTSLTRQEADPDQIEMLLDTSEGAWLVATPRLALDPAPNGAGDCVAALFLARLLGSHDPPNALALTAGAIHGVFTATKAANKRELQLVTAQEELVSPSLTVRPQQVRSSN